MDSKDIFLLTLISITILLVLIYQSKYEKLKRLTTLLIIGFFSWSLSRGTPNGIIGGTIIFILVAGFVIYAWTKIDKKKLTDDSIESFRKESLENPEQAYKEFCALVANYGDYMQENPLSYGEIRSSSILPFSKNTLILYTINFINVLEKNMQKSLLQGIPELAYYRDDIPKNGYQSNASKLIENNELINPNQSDKDKLKNILEHYIEPNDFPDDLYNECEEYSKKLYIVLKKEMNKN